MVERWEYCISEFQLGLGVKLKAAGGNAGTTKKPPSVAERFFYEARVGYAGCISFK